MHNFTEAACRVVASDTRTAVADYDTALASGLRLAADVVDGFKDAGVPVGQSQKVYRTIAESFQHLLAGRSSIASAIAQLLAMKRASNCAEVAAGCPIGWDVFLEADAGRLTVGNDLGATHAKTNVD